MNGIGSLLRILQGNKKTIINQFKVDLLKNMDQETICKQEYHIHTVKQNNQLRKIEESLIETFIINSLGSAVFKYDLKKSDF